MTACAQPEGDWCFIGWLGRLVAVAALAVAVWVGHAQAADRTPPADAVPEYRLGPGDKIRVIVFGEENLSGTFEVDSSGRVSLPLIGGVQAQGLSLRQFERRLEEKYADGFLRQPQISVEVTNYRPFFIFGEVRKPGQYPYESGMTVLKAVSTAGGYTYRANKNRVMVRREGKGEEVKVSTDEFSVLIMPGDVIRVPERFF